MRRWLLAILLMGASAPLVPAQNPNPNARPYPKTEFFVGYLDSGEFPYNVFRFGQATTLESDFGTHHGLEASVIRNLNRYLGFEGDFSAHFHHDHGPVNICSGTPCSPLTQNAELTPRLFNFLAGPEVKGRNHTRLTPFAYALFGLAHTTAAFKTAGPAVNLSLKTSETGFAMAFGGGLDIRLTQRFGFRTSLDYNPKWVGRDDNGARQIQNDLRFSVGVLFH